MPLEFWDARRRKWILYTSQEEHSADCAKYPIENIPTRIFLDTNIVNILIKHAASVFELQSIPHTLSATRANEVEALMHIFQAGQRAHWELVASENTLQEIALTPNQEVREELAEYVGGLVHIGTEDAEHAHRLGRGLAASHLLSALPDYDDRVLIGNAVGLGCDAFCTADHRTIISKRQLLPNLGMTIITPTEWWSQLKPWAGLWS